MDNPTPTSPRQILITSGLPYANGSIHIGHLVEYIQTDIFVRFLKLTGHDVLFCCGDDAHGTPIMLKARQAGVTPEAWIARYFAEHVADFKKFDVAFDNFYTTHSDLNRNLANYIYEKVQAAGYVTVREIEQLFDPSANIFLPDRFVKGTCPFCKTPEQYGDSCEACSKTFDPSDLINPISVVSGATPILKKSRHLFLNLEKSRQLLLDLYAGGFVDEIVKNKLLDWFKEPLRDWDISRDEPFFGFPIPNEPGKFFYNWFDAPIGYLASLGNHLGTDAAATIAHWNQPDLLRYHFIGKDIQYFHALFWPVMLHAAGLATPTKLAIHGFLTVNGKKMSKRDGTFIKASTFAEFLDPQHLRYYYASKLTPQPDDLDLSLEDFAARVDSELVGKLANLLSRSATMVNKHGNLLAISAQDAIPLLNEIRNADTAIAAAYADRNFALVTRLICSLADKANKYFDEQAPWKLIKTDSDAALGVLTAALEAGRILSIYLKPILPHFASGVERLLGLNPQTWKDIHNAMSSHPITTYQPLAIRIDSKKVQAMIEQSKESQQPQKPDAPTTFVPAAAALAPQAVPGEVPTGAVPPTGTTPSSTPAAPPAKPAAPDPNALAPIINFDQFMAVDLRVARVITAEPLEKSDKLMKITLDVGPLGNRTILAGIKKAYTPDRLVGRLIIFCANLAPRTMGKFGTSEGMILAAGPGPVEVFVLTPDTGAQPGQRIH